MENLPINKKLKEKLEQQAQGIVRHPGIFEINQNQYLKLLSRLHSPIIMPHKNHTNSLEDTIRCAKVYQKFIEEGIYHPKTRIVIYEYKEHLALMVIMPNLNINKEESLDDSKKERLKTIIRKFNLGNENDPLLLDDLFRPPNWGYDDEIGNSYAFDIHIAFNYKTILKFAEKMGIE